MKYTFHLSSHHRVNVWINEAPAAAYAASSIESTIVKPKLAIDAESAIACVEVNFSHGPKSSYALLGAELVKAEADGLEICVSVGKGNTAFVGALGDGLDNVEVGLPREYAAAVASGATRIADNRAVPSKHKLWYRWSVHGLLNSSPLVFQLVSGIVLELLLLPRVEGDAHIRALFEGNPWNDKTILD